MKKLFIISSFPAPYRVAVFQGLSEYYETDVFFEFIKDQSRSSKWFVREKAFHVLTDPGELSYFGDCIRRLNDYDLVLAYDYNNKNARNVMLHCIARHVPYCINCDGAFIHRNWLKDIVKGFFISHARACFASGRFARDYFLHYGAKPEQIFFHRFTSLIEGDVYKSVASKEEKRRLRQELGIPEAARVALSIGQFIYRKGYDILLDAWQKSDDTWLILIGGGERQQEYEEKIQKSELDNVQLRGFAEKEQIFKYYRASDVFVLPTREDIWGLVVNEAMACGLPVIATDRCVAALELLENGKNGYVVTSEDREQLRKKTESLLQDEELCRQMGQRNLEKMSDCTISQIIRRHIEVIERL